MQLKKQKKSYNQLKPGNRLHNGSCGAMKIKSKL